MPRPDYLPRRDADLDVWAANFSQRLSASPESFGATAPEAEQVAGLVEAFHLARSVALNPQSRTKPAVALKDQARRQLTAVLRPLVRRIQAFPGLSDADRADLALSIPGERPVTSSAIDSPPLLIVQRQVGFRARVLIRDAERRTSRQKPRGALGAGLWVKLGDEAPVGTDECRFATLATASQTMLQFASSTHGQHAWVIARWFNTRGQQGPASAAVRFRIAG